jgi:hypothetical protein
MLSEVVALAEEDFEATPSPGASLQLQQPKHNLILPIYRTK